MTFDRWQSTVIAGLETSARRSPVRGITKVSLRRRVDVLSPSVQPEQEERKGNTTRAGRDRPTDQLRHLPFFQAETEGTFTVADSKGSHRLLGEMKTKLFKVFWTSRTHVLLSTLVATVEQVYWMDPGTVLVWELFPCMQRNTPVPQWFWSRCLVGVNPSQTSFSWAVLINQERKHILTSNSLLLFQLTVNSATILAQPPAH